MAVKKHVHRCKYTWVSFKVVQLIPKGKQYN